MNNELEFLYLLEHNLLIPNRNEFLALFPIKPERIDYGHFYHSTFNFKKMLAQLEARYLKADTAVLQGLNNISKTFFESAPKTLYRIDLSDQLCTLKEYLDLQIDYLSSCCKSFKNSVQETLEGIIGSTEAQQADMYQRMVSLTQRILHTILLTIVSDTLYEFTNSFSKFLNDNSDLLHQPQFSIDLVFTSEKTVGFSPTEEEFKIGIIQLFIKLEKAVVDLPIVNLPLIDVDTSTVSFADCVAEIIQARNGFGSTLELLVQRLTDYATGFRHIESDLSLDSVGFCKDFDLDGNQSLDEYRSKIQRFNSVLSFIQMIQPVRFGLFKLQSDDFKESSSKHMKELIFSLLNQVKVYALSESDELELEFHSISVEIKKNPDTPEDLAKLKEFIHQIEITIKDRQAKIDKIKLRFDFLDEFIFDISKDELEKKITALELPNKLAKDIDEVNDNLTVRRIEMLRNLRNNQAQLEKDTSQLSEQIPEFKAKYRDLEMTFEAVDIINKYQEKLTELKDQQDKFLSHSKIFQADPVPCTLR